MMLNKLWQNTFFWWTISHNCIFSLVIHTNCIGTPSVNFMNRTIRESHLQLWIPNWVCECSHFVCAISVWSYYKARSFVVFADHLNLGLFIKYYCNIISISSSYIACFIPSFRINNIDFRVKRRKAIYKWSLIYCFLHNDLMLSVKKEILALYITNVTYIH